ncbi:MAG: hypothetical protein HY301_17520 [Verrucomicrobia bacterium]|nr:hypothetical protein [Verrucomicrobiota bacterium]
MIEWNIQSRSHACQACQKPFADQEAYHTLLFDERGNFARLDACEACWQSQFSQGATSRKGFVSHWQGVYLAPPPQVEAIRHETAETLLKKLVEANEDRHVATRYILAVMLERKRILKVRDQLRQEGKRFFVYEHAGNGDAYTILDPQLQLHQLEEVQREVAHLLEHGLTPPPAVEPVPAADAPPAEAAPAH